MKDGDREGIGVIEAASERGGRTGNPWPGVASGREFNSSLEHQRMVVGLAMQSSRMGAWERDVEAGTVWWSEELEEIFGLEKGSFGGTVADFHTRIHRDDQEASRGEVERAIAERRPYQFEFRFIHADGSIRWMEGRGQAVYSDDGKPTRLYGVGIDITERKESEKQERFLTDLGRAVQQITDPSEIMAVTAQMLGDHLGVDRCAYAEVESESVFVITGNYMRDVPSIVGRWRVAAFGSECERQMIANEPYVVYDSATDPRIGPEDLPAYEATNIAAVICVPLHKAGKFTAAMAVHQKTARHWTGSEIQLVRTVVNRCWESLERTRAAREVKESEERFRLALSSGSITVYEQDTNLRYKWIYPEAPYPPDVIGRTDEELDPDEAGKARTRIKRKVIETGLPVREEVFALVNGRRCWYYLLVEPRHDSDGNIIGVGGTALDITDRKEAELERNAMAEELAASEARFRSLMEQAPFSIQLFEPGGRHIRVNRAWEELWGLTFEQIPEYNVLNDSQLESRGIAGQIRRAFAGEAVDLPAIEYDPNETVPTSSSNAEPRRWVSAIAYPLKSPDGRVSEVALIHQDITARTLAENALVFQKTLLEALTESVQEGILIVSPAGEMLHANQHFIDIWNFPPDVAAARSDDAALEWAAQQTIDPAGFLRRVRAIYQQPDQTSREEVVMNDGRVLERYGAPIYKNNDRLGWVWTFRDITERKTAEMQLQQARVELERRVADRTKELAEANESLVLEIGERVRAENERLQLLRRLLTIQEDERGRIARDIHDQLGQRVTGLRLKTASIKELCGEDGELAKRVDRLQQIGEQLDHEITFIAWDLRPSVLDDLHFVDALENYVVEWARQSNIATQFHTNGLTDTQIDHDVEINLYRIAQEALNNSAKHSGAANVSVLLERREGGLLLIIEDDGVGMSPGKLPGEGDFRKGFGLVGMRERASLIGGTIQIESKEGQGTTVFVRVPLVSQAR